MSNVISNCKITKSDSTLLKPWIESVNSKDYKIYKCLHSGVDISGKSAYSICYGVIIEIGKSTDGYSVSIQYDVSACIRYCYLKSIAVSIGSTVSDGQLIGTASKSIHLEYITTTKKSSIWPVRIGQVTYYKHNPTDILNSGVPVSSYQFYLQLPHHQEISFSDISYEMFSEFSNNRGD